MRKAEMISETLLSLVKEAIDEKKAMADRLSEIDSLIAGITHELELVRLNVVQSYKVTVKLQELLRERREIKHEISALNSLCDSIRNHNLLPTMTKVESGVKRIVKRQDDLIEDRGIIRNLLGAKKLMTV